MSVFMLCYIEVSEEWWKVIQGSKWERRRLRVITRTDPEPALGIDPERKTGDRGDDERISGKQFALFVERDAKHVSENNGGEGEEADERFHDAVHLGN